jgi:hypothetical protein
MHYLEIETATLIEIITGNKILLGQEIEMIVSMKT